MNVNLALMIHWYFLFSIPDLFVDVRGTQKSGERDNPKSEITKLFRPRKSRFEISFMDFTKVKAETKSPNILIPIRDCSSMSRTLKLSWWIPNLTQKSAWWIWKLWKFYRRRKANRRNPIVRAILSEMLVMTSQARQITHQSFNHRTFL